VYLNKGEPEDASGITEGNDKEAEKKEKLGSSKPEVARRTSEEQVSEIYEKATGENLPELIPPDEPTLEKENPDKKSC